MPVVEVEGGGYDLGGIVSAYPYRPGVSGPYYGAPGAYWGGPVPAAPHAYGYECPRQLVPIRLRSGRIVWRWRRVC